LRLSHAQLLHLRPEHLAAHAKADAEARKLLFSIPEIPMSPIPPGLLDSVRSLQAAGWAFVLHGLDLGPYNLASLILLEPAVVTLKAELVTGAWADHRRLRSLVRLTRAMNTLGASIVAGGIEAKEDLKVLQVLGVPYGWGALLSAKAAVLGPAGQVLQGAV
jgi:EAL domain-containing protein (putative c-di-GMP-specific phosphodiesterase class I)